jgi:hypothetical protein
VLEDVRPGLFTMALIARLVFPNDAQPLGLSDLFAMGVVAINTRHPPLSKGMMIGQIELGLFVNMALETRLGVLLGVEDVPPIGIRTALVHMQTARAVTSFAACALDSFTFPWNRDARVEGQFKILGYLLMTRSARFHAHVRSARNFRWRHYGMVQCRTRDHNSHDKKRKSGDNYDGFLRARAFHILPFQSN